MDHKWLEQFNGQHVTIITTGADERSDTGTLIQMGAGWLQVGKDNGEMILVPDTAIRQIKLLELTQTVPVSEREPLPPISTHIYEPAAQTLP